MVITRTESGFAISGPSATVEVVFSTYEDAPIALLYCRYHESLDRVWVEGLQMPEDALSTLAHKAYDHARWFVKGTKWW